eukprot:CAMPEP_0116153060 /NCGR_PEP_ID=MMETSP0329-20121206/21020_1 /TAXON_ID=697910 /ORGANISM="Pseudo-nitzschia arenysensis, Strain B593" /LENGTH=186 /DNA_ID=CAMNT_0003649897 /DNA_START=108 /DNA_END=668 /DNA_ORIENTATION=-
MSKFSEDEPVTFRVVMTSDAAIKEVPLTTSTTKLMELKQILAKEEYFGSKAPVRRQRLFHLGRELKSGGRSLCKLGLGKFNNRILHLCIRPGVDGSDTTGEKVVGDGASATAGSRKRSLAASDSAQEFQRQRRAPETMLLSQGGGIQVSSIGPPVAAPSNSNTSNNIHIDLVDSSDDDEVEVIEVL